MSNTECVIVKQDSNQRNKTICCFAVYYKNSLANCDVVNLRIKSRKT